MGSNDYSESNGMINAPKMRSSRCVVGLRTTPNPVFERRCIRPDEKLAATYRTVTRDGNGSEPPMVAGPVRIGRQPANTGWWGCQNARGEAAIHDLR